MKCITLANIDSAITCGDNDNLAGIVDNIIFGYHEDVATWPTLPSGTQESPLTLAAAGALTGDVVMKTGTCAYKLQFTDGTGNFTMTDQGEEGAESVLNQLDIIRSKITDVILGFMNATRGRKLFIIVTDKNGNSYLMGDKLNGAKRIAADAAAAGQAATDRNGVPLRFTYSSPRNLLYKGDKENLLVVVQEPAAPAVEGES